MCGQCCSSRSQIFVLILCLPLLIQNVYDNHYYVKNYQRSNNIVGSRSKPQAPSRLTYPRSTLLQIQLSRAAIAYALTMSPRLLAESLRAKRLVQRSKTFKTDNLSSKAHQHSKSWELQKIPSHTQRLPFWLVLGNLSFRWARLESEIGIPVEASPKISDNDRITTVALFSILV